MLGAILGDIVGSPYEFDHNNYKHKDFPLLSEKSHFTDDTVMTAAVARGLIAGKGIPERTFEETKSEMRIWGETYPHAGYGVEKMVNIQRHLPEDERAEKVIFVITTDGLENASKRFSYEKIRRMIEREKERYGWEFLFLGANMDAVQEAARFGIGADRAVRFENDARGVAVNYHAVSETVCRMRQAACPASIGAEWKEEIEADFQKRHHR